MPVSGYAGNGREGLGLFHDGLDLYQAGQSMGVERYGIDDGDDGEGEAHRRPIPKVLCLHLLMVNIRKAMA